MTIKFGARIVRGFIYGISLGGIVYLVLNLLSNAINTLAGSTLVNPGAAGLIGFGLTLFASVGIELSKEMEENKTK